MNNRKQIFNYFKNIINYDGDISKFFSKKNNFIPIINSKKSAYINNNHNIKNNFLMKVLIFQLFLLILVLIVYILKIFFFK